MWCGFDFGCFVFFFKQKTAYEMSISDWSSDVCSSDLRGDIFDQGLLELGLDSHAELVAQLVTVYREHHPDIALQPDARRFLEASRPGQAIALLTDGHLVSQQRKIEALGIAAYGVNPLVITRLWGRYSWKPPRRGFRRSGG